VNRQFQQVKKFHEACGIEMPDKPQMLSRGNQKQSLDCVKYGQSVESLSAMMKNIPDSSEVMKRASWMAEELSEFLYAETIEDQADALTDLMYFAIGTFTLMGLKPESIFDIVAAANLGKVGPDGKVIRDAQGKIKKPDNWHELFAPEQKIKAEIERQIDAHDKDCFCPDCW
jgi:predicted HAD superfamily Cof-like phosphohydrolase